MHWLVHSSASASRGFFICKLNRDPQNLYKWLPPKIGDWCVPSGVVPWRRYTKAPCVAALLLKRRAH